MASVTLPTGPPGSFNDSVTITTVRLGNFPNIWLLDTRLAASAPFSIHSDNHPTMPKTLTIHDHSRDSAGMTHVYPVISRRSGGLSIGINLNPNNACNWRCIYCQVPGLRRGSGPEVDPCLLEDELRHLLDDVLRGDFYDRYALPQEQRVIRDIAISGNGEPTSCPNFADLIGVIGQMCAEYALFGQIKLVLITNGSLMHQSAVQRGLARWAELGGEVWFKLDRATSEGMQRINSVHLAPESVAQRLEICTRLCPTWIQTCWFALDGDAPSLEEQKAYIDYLDALRQSDTPFEGVLLYGLARPSMQVESPRLSALPAALLEEFGRRIIERGIPVSIHG
jgi:wyosine [tRNA(Phe)-imidazoG37] synthetase (radical SAM superfamily)